MELHTNELNQKSTSTSQYEAEKEIKKIINDFHAAVLARDIDKVMSFYSNDIVAFDIVPPLQYVGKKAYRKSWEKAFEVNENENNPGYDLHNLKVTVGGDIAFCHELNHCFSTSKGDEIDMWMRGTHCFKKIDGKWLITHEQFSVPIDFESGMGLTDLQPEKNLH